MKIKINFTICDKCGCCVAICPQLAIEISEQAVYINSNKCISCQKCINTCPLGAISNVTE